MRQLFGVLCVLTAGISFGFMPLFKRWIITSDPQVSNPVILFLRFSIAACVLGVITFAARLPMPKGRVLLAYIAMGCIGYFGEAYCFFGALDYISGALVSLLLYTYPAFVTLGAWKFMGERLTARTIAALIVATAGMTLTVWPALSEHSAGGGKLIGIALGIGTAIIYGGYVLTGSVLSRHWNGPIQSSLVIMSSAAAMFAGVAVFRGDSLPHGTGAWVGVVSLSLVTSVIAITALLAGLAILGPVRTSALSLVEPLSTVVVGSLFMNERLVGVQWVGGILILTGAALSISPGKRQAAES
jgi:drug/metabolite transporter (DMT)-like permease